ncbi:MAG: MarR family winged helix-turn-helix transcriptional regulator [Acetanaerobacterium sp.]
MLHRYEIADLNPAQGRILFALWQHGAQPISALAKRTALRKNTLTGMLERLEQAGHIARSQNKGDRRESIISLTAKSEALRKRYDAVSAEMIGVFYDGLSGKQIDVFEKTLRHILNNLTKYEEETK